ncbi:lipoprotein [Streptomyces sp. NPDC048290]|uniref:lipoprotein n=1 Tax=Streptomyces sp. NPDC048290 TaxID=3155811 RepID=UPI0034424666
MRVGPGNRAAAVAVAVAVIGLTGCGSGGGGRASTPEPASTLASASASASAAQIRPGGTLGGAGSPCELPVTFDIAEEWTAESVDTPLEIGSVTLACEIDAKPAGHIGYLRVWTGTPGDDDPEAVLRAHLAVDTGAVKSGERYRSLTIGGAPAAEVSYVSSDDILGERPELAFALTTPDGPVVVTLDAPDADEHEAVRPGYELARRTLRPAG